MDREENDGQKKRCSDDGRFAGRNTFCLTMELIGSSDPGGEKDDGALLDHDDDVRCRGRCLYNMRSNLQERNEKKRRGQRNNLMLPVPSDDAEGT